MKVLTIVLLILVFFFTACESDESPFGLKGTIKGEIGTYNEFGYERDDRENVRIQLEGSDPLISFLTDSTGNYEINNIPTGTYNFVVSKEGYCDFQRQGMQIVGGTEPIYFSSSLSEVPSTTIENLSLEIVNVSEIHIKGVVFHNYREVQGIGIHPEVRYFVHKSANPSGSNYLQTGSFSFISESGTSFDLEVGFDKRIFPSGSVIYLIAYGSNSFSSAYYDILSNTMIYNCLGSPSNSISIIIP